MGGRGGHDPSLKIVRVSFVGNTAYFLSKSGDLPCGEGGKG
jgi:hypothetical protein